MSVDEGKRRRRRGPVPLEPSAKRQHTVSARFNPEELEQLDQVRSRVGMQRGEFLRAAALHRLPPTIPAVNQEAWAGLSRSAANLNQIAHRLNALSQGSTVPLPDFEEVAAILADFRRKLIGVDNGSLHEPGARRPRQPRALQSKIQKESP